MATPTPAESILEAEVRELRKRIAALEYEQAAHVADLAALKRIHALSTSITATGDFESLLQQIMDASVAIVEADQGTLQLVQDDSLRIVAHHGHQPPFLEFFACADERVSVCGEALRRGERVIVEDVERSELFAGAPSLAVLREAGVRAVQSTPLLSRNGMLLGILTTHWRLPYIPDEHDVWRIDLLARQAADLIEQARSSAEIHRLAQFPEQNPGPVLRIDADRRLLYANAPAREWLAAAGANVTESLPPGIQTLVAEALRQGKSIAAELLDGRGRTWWFLANRPTSEPFVNLYGHEITKRKRAEESLLTSEKLLAAELHAMTRLHELGTLFVREGNLEPILDEIVDAAIAISDADFGNIQLLDPKSGDLTIVAHRGFPTWWLEFWNVVARGEGTCGTALERGERVVVEDVEHSPIFTGKPALEIQRRAGVRAVQSTPLVSRSGRPLGMFSTHYQTPHSLDDRALRLLDLLARQAADIIDKAQAEDTIAGAVQRLNAHMDNSPLAVVEFDPQFHVTRWSKEAERIFGWGADEIVGRTIEEMGWVYEDDADLVRQVSQDMFDGTRPRNLNRNRNYRKDGRVIECEWYNSAIYDSEGKMSSILSQVLDVTERKQSEERLRQAQKMESLGLLAGGVAHDFNNLLVGVIGNASLAQEMLPPDHPATALMGNVIKTGEQAAHLTRQMLAYSGKGQFLLEVLDLSAMVNEINDLVRPSISKKVVLHLDLEQQVPPIEADRGQVQQILMNLVINAAEAIGSGNGIVTVRTGVQIVDGQYHRLHLETVDLRPGEYVLLEVCDTGCGMADDVKAKMFDPFFSTKFTGRGLGLAAVAGIVRGHKGAIVVSSEPGRGSSLTVLFPPATRPIEQRQSAAPSALAQSAGVVLVVDDEEVVRDMANRALARHGYTVLVAHDGATAIDLFKRHRGDIELVLLDLSMPGLSGEETLRELRKIQPEARVLVSSGYSETEAMTMFRGQRVSGFIQKPYTSAGIAHKVKAALAPAPPVSPMLR
ncbi:MAG: hypothetical protein C5B51_10315 [Terriglobia bacterium]|nr:MAG: hypothetical protein C5B51_10315 [Terriglobia bacterium]